MGIKNLNVAKNADIDLSKLNLLDGKRAFWEDFDEGAATTITSLYGFSQIVAATGAATCVNPSLGKLDCPNNNDKVLIFGGSQWHSDRNCKMTTRVTAITSLASVNMQFGWGDNAAMVIDGPVSDHDWAYLEFRAGTNDGKWLLNTRIAGSAAVAVDTGIPVASATIYNLSVELLPSGRVIAKVNGDIVQSGSSAAIKTGAADWQPFARISASAGGGKFTTLDTFAVYENRTA